MRNEYKTTTNTTVYNRIHKEKNAVCSCCTWHPRWFNKYSENDRWAWYNLDESPDAKLNSTKWPNWKLVSKKKKQWMKKPLRFKKELSLSSYYKFDVYRIEW